MHINLSRGGVTLSKKLLTGMYQVIPRQCYVVIHMSVEEFIWDKNDRFIFPAYFCC